MTMKKQLDAAWVFEEMCKKAREREEKEEPHTAKFYYDYFEKRYGLYVPNIS